MRLHSWKIEADPWTHSNQQLVITELHKRQAEVNNSGLVFTILPEYEMYELYQTLEEFFGDTHHESHNPTHEELIAQFNDAKDRLINFIKEVKLG